MTSNHAIVLHRLWKQKQKQTNKQTKQSNKRELRFLITRQIVCLCHGSVGQSLIVRWVLQLQL